MTKDALEGAIELRERLKANVVRDFADALIRIQQLRAGVFESDARDVIGELLIRWPCGKLCRNERRLHQLLLRRQSKIIRFRLVPVDVLAGLKHERRLGVLRFNDQLIRQSLRVARQKMKSNRTMALYLSGGMSGFLSHALRISLVNRNTASLELRGLTLVASDFAGKWRKHLTNPQVSDDVHSPSFTGTAVSVKPNGQVTVCGMQSGVIDHILVRLQTNAESGGVFGEESAEWIFVFFAVMRELPKFQRPKHQRQASRFSENTFVIPKQSGPAQHVDKLLVRFRAPCSGLDHIGKRLSIAPSNAKVNAH